jgi:hypothetical protein
MVNNELESMWKEAILALFKILSRYLTGGTEEKYDLRLLITTATFYQQRWNETRKGTKEGQIIKEQS